jgi:glycosyltransferase involved in cell wall biosynthesis
MDYPKLLILNNYSFNDYKGGGITLKNLFLGWPKDKIAIAHLSEPKPMTNVCEKYFKIGYNESQYVFPINKLSNEPRGDINGPYSAKDFNQKNRDDSVTESQDQINTSSRLKKWILHTIDKLGIYEFVHPLRMSKSLRRWILEFNPEIIYCQPENISFINLALKSQNITNAKLVVHVMDDWPYLVYKDKTLKPVLRATVKRKFQKLLEHSSLRLGISKAMAIEFQNRYNLPFKYFHNPIDLSKINDLAKNDKPQNGSYLVVYSGRIGWTASHDSIIEISKCVEELIKEGLDIRFNIYTDLSDRENDFTRFLIKGTSLLPALKDNDFITKLMDADLLLYPVDFDRKSIEFIRLSFPTKLPSYLISGTPVFCYGPSEVYSIRFMKENELGFICNEQKLDVVKKAILDALTNKELREKFSRRAYFYAKNNFDMIKVTSLFHQELANCIL